MNSLFITVTVLLLSQTLAKFINYDDFIHSEIYNNGYKEVAEYAKANGYPDFDDRFEYFKVKYNKHYANAEEEERRKYYFLQSLMDIAANEEMVDRGSIKYELGINSMADMSMDEFKGMQLNWDTVNLNEMSSHKRPPIATSSALPQHYDWRERNVVTDVKDQGRCGSCWAFATIASIESAYAIKLNQTDRNPVDFSEQQLLDCAYGGEFVSKGCEGGTIDDSFRYAIVNGVVNRKDYPYIEQQTDCQDTSFHWKLHLADYHYSQNMIDVEIMQTVYNIGPVVVYINGEDREFMLYSNGTLSSAGNREIFGSKTLHILVIVGWGTDENGNDYWIIKNSYGKWWGIEGYMRLKRNINSRGINTIVAYPIIGALPIGGEGETTKAAATTPVTTKAPTTAAAGTTSAKPPTTAAGGTTSAKPPTTAAGATTSKPPTTAAAGTTSAKPPTTAAAGTTSAKPPTTAAGGTTVATTKPTTTPPKSAAPQLYVVNSLVMALIMILFSFNCLNFAKFNLIFT